MAHEPQQDPLTLAERARLAARDEALAAHLEARKMIVRPAEGDELTAEEQDAADRAWLASPTIPTDDMAELQARFKLTREKPIPRRTAARDQLALRAVKSADKGRVKGPSIEKVIERVGGLGAGDPVSPAERDV